MDGSAKVQKKIKSIVIGGGFGGIAAALRLKAKGHDVTLIEKHKSSDGDLNIKLVRGEDILKTAKLKNKNVQKYNNNLLNWIYLSSSSSHSSLYSAQNALKEQFNININDVLSRDFNVKQQFWCDFETKVTAHWENEMVESTPWTYEQVTEKKLNYCFQNS